MPIIKSAKKKLRIDRKKTTQNAAYKTALKKIIKEIRKPGKKVADAIKKLYSIVDKAVKKGIIHKNKAGRIKSRASKSLRKKT